MNSQYEAESITETEFKEGLAYFFLHWMLRENNLPGLLELQGWLTECRESLQLESPGTHKKNLSEKAGVMLENLKECIKYLDFL